jgi:hypothetical protein
MSRGAVFRATDLNVFRAGLFENTKEEKAPESTELSRLSFILLLFIK